MFAVLHAQRAEGRVKDLAVGLLAVQLLGDENVLQKRCNARLRHTAALHLVKAVGHNGQRGHLGKLAQHFQHIGAHQVRMGGKALQIIAVHLHAVAGSVDRFQKAGKALTHQLFAADLSLFQLFPELFVDGAVGLHRLGIRLNAVIDQRFRQSLALGGVKVQKCIVRVKQDAIIFCHCVPLSHG